MSLWGGRFTGKTDPLMESFNQSLSFDKRMWKADIQGSIAYSNAIHKKNIITLQEKEALHKGFKQVYKEWELGTFKILPSDEDIHTANERRLGEIIGTQISGKLHTGRSRNDQVVTDMRLWLRDEIKGLLLILKEFIRVFYARAESEIDVLMPGYTHLQRAQPIRWSHLILSHAWAFQSDAERLVQLYDRVNQSPLGSGALAGNPFGVDRDAICAELSFSKVIPNSLYAVSDRDFVAEFLYWSSMVITHLSRWSEDLIVYSSAEFGFISLADAYSTGSSLMPQKKNPDSLELIRGKSGRIFGNMTGFMMTLKGLPSTYNKDLQEDKEPMFDTMDNLSACIQISTGVMSTLKVNSAKMLAALSMEMLATDVAEYLVRKGVPFRETHHISGSAVRISEEKNIPLSKLDLATYKSLHPAFEEDLFKIFNFETSVESRNSKGGTCKESVLEQIKLLKELVEKDLKEL